MARQRRRPITQRDLDTLSKAYGIISMQRDEVRSAGAHHAAAYIGRALKSLDGAIRHGQGMLSRQEGRCTTS